MNYDEEMDAIAAFKPTEFWKPARGATTIVILSEPTEGVFTEEDGTKKPVVNIEVSVGEHMMKWTVSKAYGEATLWTQLVKIAKARNDKLVGAVIKVNATGEKKSRRYFLELVRKQPLEVAVEDFDGHAQA